MIIDAHSHLVDRKLFESIGGKIPQNMFDEHLLLEAQERAGVDMSIISGPRVMETGTQLARMDATSVAKEYNDYVATLVAKYPKRLAGLGIAHPLGGEPMFREMERSVKELGLKGFLVIPRYGEEFLDAPRMGPFFECVEDLGAVVFVHNADGCLCAEYMSENRLMELVGRPNEMTLLVARMIFAGMMERYPRLKLLLGRLGGAITLYAGRIQNGWETRHSRSDGVPPWGQDVLKRPFMESLRKVYVDTQTFHSPAIRCAVETMGEDQVLLGSDFPPVPRPLLASVEDVRASGIPASAVGKVLGSNAVKLFAL